MYNQKIVKSSIMVVMLIFLSKFLGFIREAVIAAYYGANWETDAFCLAQSIPTVILSFIIAVLTTLIMPMYIEKSEKVNENSANQYINAVLHNVFILLVIITIIGVVFAEQIVIVFAPSFSGATKELAINLTRILFLPVVFVGITNVFSTILNAKKKFVVPRLIGIPQSIFMIFATILCSGTIGIYSLPIGTIIGNTIMLLISCFFVKKIYTYKVVFKLEAEDKFKIKTLVLPILIGTSISQINVVVDKIFASGLNEGSISALSYSEKLTSFLTGAWNTAIVTVMFSYISTAYAKNKMDDLKHYLSSSIVYIFCFAAPVTMITVLFSTEIIEIIFGRGNFDTEAVRLTALALMCYAPSMLAYGLRDMLSRFFYAIQDTKTPMINSSFSVVLNIVMNAIFVSVFGVGGIALSTSISVIIVTMLLFRSATKKNIEIQVMSIFYTLFKVGIASIIAAIGAKIIYSCIGTSYVSIFISICGAVLLYIIMLVLLKVDEICKIIQIICVRNKRRGLR